MTWVSSLGEYYTRKAENEIEDKQIEKARTTLEADIIMAQQVHDDSFSLAGKLACLKITKPALESLQRVRAMARDLAGMRQVQRGLTNLNAWRSELGALMSARNTALQPPRAAGKTEAQWISFMDDVLERGEVDAIRSDDMIGRHIPLR